jgi:hypothetical protein
MANNSRKTGKIIFVVSDDLTPSSNRHGGRDTRAERSRERLDAALPPLNIQHQTPNFITMSVHRTALTPVAALPYSCIVTRPICANRHLMNRASCRSCAIHGRYPQLEH